jgi:hypothetical protein
MTGSEDKGSRASDEVRERMVKALALSDKRIIEKKITQLLNWIFELNAWGPAPYAELWEPEDYDTERADRDKILKELGVSFTKKYFTEKYNFEEDDIEITPATPDHPFTKSKIPIPSGERGGGEVLPIALAEADAAVKVEEDELTKLVKSVAPLLEKAIEPLVKSIKTYFNDSSSFAEAMEKTQTLLLKASTDEIENIIARINYIAFLKGSADVIGEEK